MVSFWSAEKVKCRLSGDQAKSVKLNLSDPSRHVAMGKSIHVEAVRVEQPDALPSSLVTCAPFGM